tara:strand:- start:422 stop:598 length:177 start_codon:yes stop_codon:yes gene_type:complete
MFLLSLEAAVVQTEERAVTSLEAAAVEACWLPLARISPLDRKQSPLVLAAQQRMTMAV